ncbi:MAG: lytic murein transglycosylase, partial [Burkholderiales bacterium]
LSGPNTLEVLDLGLKPSLSLAQFKEKGVEATESPSQDIQAGLFSLDIEQGQEHWLAFNNFYVLTRYNRSKNYAMAVYQLAVAIAQARAAEQRTASTPRAK